MEMDFFEGRRNMYVGFEIFKMGKFCTVLEIDL